MDTGNNKNFGFQKVSATEKRSLVDGVFSDVAKKYDIMNDLMSAGIHRLWKKEFCQQVHNFNSKILDVAGGTGDIAFRLKKMAQERGDQLDITVTDINPKMLEICKQEAINRNILNGFQTIVADAEKLPFDDNSFDYYTISFGIRNVVNIEQALKEAYRVLKPGGSFLCLEFSKVNSQILSSLYHFYSFNILPKIGRLVANNEPAYRYLAESIELFPGQDQFKKMIEDVGFRSVNYHNLSFGIAAIHRGLKI